MNLWASSVIQRMGWSLSPFSAALSRAHCTMPLEASRWHTSAPPSAAAIVLPPEYAKRLRTALREPPFAATVSLIHLHCARCSGNIPRWPKSVPLRRNFTPAVSIVHSLGSAPRLCQRLPSSRSNAAVARDQSSGRSGRHIAWEQGRTSDTLPNRSYFFPSPESISS